MTIKNLLLLSSSRVKDTPYLTHALPMIKDHLGDITELLFIPYAGVTVNYDEYTDMVRTALSGLNIKVVGIHETADPVEAIKTSSAVAIGGGNTFHLLHQLYEQDLIEIIRERVNNGMPYIGWSAGSNVAGASIFTTNDMPIIEPKSFKALNLLDVQLNPHYTDHNPPGHNGETRAQRLAEFMVLNPQTPILAIVEGTALKLNEQGLTLIGPENGFIFQGGKKSTMTTGEDLNRFL